MQYSHNAMDTNKVVSGLICNNMYYCRTVEYADANNVYRAHIIMILIIIILNEHVLTHIACNNVLYMLKILMICTIIRLDRYNPQFGILSRVVGSVDMENMDNRKLISG